MALSISKLQKLLSDKGLVIKKIFQINNLCVYIEVINILTADNFLIYIPSKYEIQAPPGNNYKIEYLELDDNGDISEDFDNLENQYDEIDLGIKTDTTHINIEKQLQENYNQHVSVDNHKKNNEIQDIKDILKQLKRFKFSVQNIRYKLCIHYKNYLCCIRRDDSLEGFRIKDYKGVNEEKILITLDLETFYEKIDSLVDDIRNVKQGIYKILNKNQLKNINNLETILDQKFTLQSFSKAAEDKKNNYTFYISQFETLLNNIVVVEKQNINKIFQIEEKYKNINTVLEDDIARTHEIKKYQTEISKINLIKQEIITNIMLLNQKLENISLKLDKIYFDNTVMIDKILKNFILLSEL